MGHLVGKDIYRKLAGKIDGLTTRAPYNETFRAILAELYTADEADLVIKMPYGLSTVAAISKCTGYDETYTCQLLEKLADKGLVMDLWMGGEYRYMPSPVVIGIFEFTMMRTGPDLNPKKWARLFHDYLEGDDHWYRANFGKGEKVSPLRTLPHEGSIQDGDFVEVLDYEKATAIVKQADKFAIGLCSCRHEKMHTGDKTCDVPLENCSSFGPAADYLIRHGMAREVSKSEMLDNVARSKDMGLVFNADNVQQQVSFICHCCGCCCNVLLGISRFGYPNVVVTSNYIAHSDESICTGCGDCVEACPINAIELDADSNPVVDEAVCLGCGVCALGCETEAMRLVARKQRVLHPETTFERVILQCLEKGTLQNQMFPDPGRISHTFMRGVLGAFLKMQPVKKALMSETLRSSFLETMKKRA
jgi:Pyruvate/2-oxoacid:ferredoxin oxidoreductase delta subunit